MPTTEEKLKELRANRERLKAEQAKQSTSVVAPSPAAVAPVSATEEKLKELRAAREQRKATQKAAEQKPNSLDASWIAGIAAQKRSSTTSQPSERGPTEADMIAADWAEKARSVPVVNTNPTITVPSPAAANAERERRARGEANIVSTQFETRGAAGKREIEKQKAIDTALVENDALLGRQLTKEEAAFRQQGAYDASAMKQSFPVSPEITSSSYVNRVNDLPFVGTQQIKAYNRAEIADEIARLQNTLDLNLAGEPGSEKHGQITRSLTALQQAQSQMQAKGVEKFDLRYDPDIRGGGIISIPDESDYIADMFRQDTKPGLTEKEMIDGMFNKSPGIMKGVNANITSVSPPDIKDPIMAALRPLAVAENVALRGVDALTPSDLPKSKSAYRANILDPEGRAAPSDIKQTTADGEELGFWANVSRDVASGRSFGTHMAGTPVYAEFAADVARALGADEDAEAIGDTAALTAGMLTSVAMPSVLDAAPLAVGAAKSLAKVATSERLVPLYAKIATAVPITKKFAPNPITQTMVDDALEVLKSTNDMSEVPRSDKNILLNAPAELFAKVSGTLPPAAKKLEIRQQLLGDNATLGLVPRTDGTYVSPEVEQLVAEVQEEATRIELERSNAILAKTDELARREVENTIAVNAALKENQAEYDKVLTSIEDYDKQIADLDKSMTATRNADSVANKKALDTLRAELKAKREQELKRAVAIETSLEVTVLNEVTPQLAKKEAMLKKIDSSVDTASDELAEAKRFLLESQAMLKDDTLWLQELDAARSEIAKYDKKLASMDESLKTAKGQAKKTLETWIAKYTADRATAVTKAEKTKNLLSTENMRKQTFNYHKTQVVKAQAKFNSIAAAAESEEVDRLRSSVKETKQIVGILKQLRKAKGTKAKEAYLAAATPLPRKAPKVSNNAELLEQKRTALVAERNRLKEVNKQLVETRKTIGVASDKAIKDTRKQLENEAESLRKSLASMKETETWLAASTTRKNPNLIDIKDTSFLTTEQKTKRWLELQLRSIGARTGTPGRLSYDTPKEANILTAREVRKEIKNLPKNIRQENIPSTLMDAMITPNRMEEANEFYLRRLFGKRGYTLSSDIDTTRRMYAFANQTALSPDVVYAIARESQLPIPTADQMLFASLDTIMAVKQGENLSEVTTLPWVTDALKDAIKSEGYAARTYDGAWLAEKAVVNIAQHSKTSSMRKAGGWLETLILDVVNTGTYTDSSIVSLPAVYRAAVSGSETQLAALGMSPENIKLVQAFNPKPTMLEVDRYSYMIGDLQFATKQAAVPLMSKDYVVSFLEQLLPNGSPMLNTAIELDMNARKLIYADALLNGATPADAMKRVASFTAVPPRIADSTNIADIVGTRALNWAAGMYSRIKLLGGFALKNPGATSRMAKAYAFKKTTEDLREQSEVGENYGSLATFGWMVDYNDKARMLILPPTIHEMNEIGKSAAAYMAGAGGLLAGGPEAALAGFRKTKQDWSYSISADPGMQTAMALMVSADAFGHSRTMATWLGMKPTSAPPEQLLDLERPTVRSMKPYEPAIVFPVVGEPGSYIAYEPGIGTSTIANALFFVGGMDDMTILITMMDSLINGELDVSSYEPNDPSSVKKALLLVGTSVLPYQLVRMKDRQRKEVMERYTKLLQDPDVQLTNEEIKLIEDFVLKSETSKEN